MLQNSFCAARKLVPESWNETLNRVVLVRSGEGEASDSTSVAELLATCLNSENTQNLMFEKYRDAAVKPWN